MLAGTYVVRERDLTLTGSAMASPIHNHQGAGPCQMGTSKDKIRDWLKQAKQMGATHTIIVCDTFDHSDYPIFVMVDQDVRKIAEEHDGPNMTRLMEVYLMEMDLEAQLREPVAMHFSLNDGRPD